MSRRRATARARPAGPVQNCGAPEGGTRGCGVQIYSPGGIHSSPHFRPEPRQAPLSRRHARESVPHGPRLARHPGVALGGRAPGFLPRGVGEASPGRGPAGGRAEVGLPGSERARPGRPRAPPGRPRGAGRAGRGWRVLGRLPRAGHVTRGPNDRRAAAAASAAGPGRRRAAEPPVPPARPPDPRSHGRRDPRAAAGPQVGAPAPLRPPRAPRAPRGSLGGPGAWRGRPTALAGSVYSSVPLAAG